MTSFDMYVERVLSSVSEGNRFNNGLDRDAAEIAADYDSKSIPQKALAVVTKSPDREIAKQYVKLQDARKKVIIPYLTKKIVQLQKYATSLVELPP